MNEITCRDCGRYESECTCNLLTTDKVKLQERIKELEALIPTKEEAEYVITTLKIPRKGCDCDGCKFYRNIAAKLQKIIDKRG